MAEHIVFHVLGKLTEPLIQEYFFLGGVSSQLKLVKLQLSIMQDFLKDASSKQKGDARIHGWVRNVRCVAFEIEDAIDRYIVEIHNIRGNHVPLWKRYILEPVELIARHKLGSRIFFIRAQIQTISESKTTLGIKNLGENGDEARLPLKKPLVPDIDNDEFVGFEVDRKRIIDSLVIGASNHRRRVISIVGPGGLGKTTLAKKVYNTMEVKRYFYLRIWLTISKDFKPIDVLKKLYEEVSRDKHNEVKEAHVYLRRLNKLLREKIYLIVLDDVWSDNVLEWLQDGLPDVGKISRVIITTRFLDIANLADSSCVFELPFLSKKESLELLLKNGLQIFDPLVNCPAELRNVAQKLANRCGGLPLAIIVLGRLLSKKPLSHIHWSQVEKNLDWYRDGELCMNILATSYDDLPYYLKSCFRYLACFPEDYEFPACTILQMWIAEGFMICNNTRTLEDEAECCLEELVQRCLIQVVRRDYDGSITTFRVHDLLRDLAVHEAKENDFLLTCTKESTHTYFNRARRVVIHNNHDQAGFKNESRLEMAMPNVRSFLNFDTELPIHIPSTSLLLRVLELEGNKNLKKLPKELKSMIHLRYLGLSNTGLEQLPKTIGALQNLQTLDICDTNVKQIPNSLWKIHALRHVFITELLGPPPLAKLVNLQSLTQFTIRKSWREELPFLPNLRNMGLMYSVEEENGSILMPDWNIVIGLLGMLKNLVSLRIEGDSIPTEIADARTSPSYKHLQSLVLSSHSNPIRVSLDAVEIPRNLVQLDLWFIWFDKDPMPKLEKLPCLRLLFLASVRNVKEIICSAKGFPQLQRLTISEWYNLKSWKVEQNAMHLLKILHINYCKQLLVLPNLNRIKTLQELHLFGVPDVLKSKLEDRTREEWQKIQHVSTIEID